MKSQKKTLESLRKFISRYSPEELVKVLNNVLQNLLENAQDGSTILLAATIVPFLLILILLLQLVIIIRLILSNLFDLFRALFTIFLEEVNFYLKLIKSLGRDLAQDLSESIFLMLSYISYLLKKVVDDDATYDDDITLRTDPLTLLINFLYWLALTMASVLISIMLLMTFFLGTPIIHQKIRKMFDG